MTNQEAKQRFERIWKDYTSAYDTVSIEDLMTFDMATNALGAIEQIQWERDMAIKQLHDLGYGLGEKPREEVKKASNLIERQKAIDEILRITTFTNVRELYEYVQEHNLTEMWCGGINDAIDCVIAVPSAQPEIEESLYQYKCFITDTEGLQHEVVHVGDIRRVTGWEI